MQEFIVMHFNQDGDRPHLETLSEEELKKRLKEAYYGEKPTFACPQKEIDTNYFSGTLIIKGEIIVPKAVQVTTEYGL